MIDNIKILGREYKVSLGQPKKKYTLGEIVWEGMEIFLKNTLDERQQKIVLTHEIGHGYLEEMGLSYTMSTAKREQLCQIVSLILTDIIQNNKDLVKWLQED